MGGKTNVALACHILSREWKWLGCHVLPWNQIEFENCIVSLRTHLAQVQVCRYAIVICKSYTHRCAGMSWKELFWTDRAFTNKGTELIIHISVSLNIFYFVFHLQEQHECCDYYKGKIWGDKMCHKPRKHWCSTAWLSSSKTRNTLGTWVNKGTTLTPVYY